MTNWNEKIIQSRLRTLWFIIVLAALSFANSESASRNLQEFTAFRSSLQLQSCLQQKKTFVPADTLLVRGGSTEDDVDENDVDLNEEDESLEAVATEKEGESIALDVSKRAFILLGKAVAALTRAVKAGFQSSDAEEESDEELTGMTKVIKVLKRMWNAALHPNYLEADDGTDSIVESTKKKAKKMKAPADVSTEKESVAADFGSHLGDSYGVAVDRCDEEGQTPVIGGTLGDALREARSKARLLVVFIPSSRPGRGKKGTPDQIAIESILSKETSEAAGKRARKKESSGSFVIWAAQSGSPEAVVAMKRLKVKQLGSKGEKRPTLLVAYPAQVFDSSGVPKLVPRVLAQHHCKPPPLSESMGAWLNALRKRHSKQYGAMQHDMREIELLKERQQGYTSSVQSDVQRQEEEEKVEQERLAKEDAEKERIEELQRRRKELLETLPEEPSKEVADAKTIALRLGDGRSGQRRFASNTPVSFLFNWVDAMFELERETVILSTMNGQKSFAFEVEDDTTLEVAGFGKMTGLRVTQKKVEEKNAEVADS